MELLIKFLATPADAAALARRPTLSRLVASLARSLARLLPRSLACLLPIHIIIRRRRTRFIARPAVGLAHLLRRARNSLPVATSGW